MKQINQNVSNGETYIDEVPLPKCKKGCLLIKSSMSLISSGTERMLVDFGKSNYIDKARKQPDKVKMVLNKIKTDGLASTYEAVKSKLEQPMPMGYSNVGEVIEVGHGVSGFKVGDRVVSNGRHAEVVCVSKNLVTKVPDEVHSKEAVFTVVSSIALQGVRITNPSIGESIVVIGLGLIGLITIQILKANGCRVLGMDTDQEKINLAKKLGIEAIKLDKNVNAIKKGVDFSFGYGVDGVIITASTKSNEPLHNAAQMSRKNGRITLVGVIGTEINRNDFYEKELTFRVSCSYGPGRYDTNYEEDGIDYPIGYVRWTENRNFEAVLEMMKNKSLNVKDLIHKKYNLLDAKNAYSDLVQDKSSLGLILMYAKEIDISKKIKISNKTYISNNSPVVGIIGSGNYAGRVLIPALKRTDVTLKTISSSQGTSSNYFGKKYGFSESVTDNSLILKDDTIKLIIIATRHDSHADFVKEGLNNNKNIFVEKPLSLNLNDLDEIQEIYEKKNLRLIVGFNRRFSPLSTSLKSALLQDEPVSIIYNCNAGHIPSESWVHDASSGGGRLVGEACHFIDYARFMTGSKIKEIDVVGMNEKNQDKKIIDTFSIIISFYNGSIANINYFANGNSSYPKERVEVFQNGNIAVIDNFRSIKNYGFNGIKNKKLLFQNKGQKELVAAFVKSLKDKNIKDLIPAEEIFEVSRYSILASHMLEDLF